MADEPIDLDMLANDIADLFDRYDYPIDVDTDDVREALPLFLANLDAIRATR